MTRLYGRSMRGERARDSAPHGHWCVRTLIGSIRGDGRTTCMTIDAPTDSDVFLAYVRKVLLPSLLPGDIVVLDNLRSHQQLLSHTEEAVSLADDVFELTAENYANGLCDINTYSLAQSRRDNAYNQHLSALAGYWTTYYHLLTLTQYE